MTRVKSLVAVGLVAALAAAVPTTAEARPAPADLVWSVPALAGPLEPNTSTSFVARLYNNGGSTARSVTVTLTGATFSVQTDSCTGVSLRAGRNCALVIGYQPTVTGRTIGTVQARSRSALSSSADVVGLSATTLTDVEEIDAGSGQTCVIDGDGAAKCWGSNWAGQLGNGTTTNSAIATQVTGLTSGVEAVSAGGQFTCAIVSGAAKCWGSNWGGQLGDASTDDRSTPVQVSGMTSGVTAIGTGDDHACAIQSGALYCWGANGGHELGDGTTDDSSIPVMVSGMSSGVTALAVGSHHTCAVVSGTLKCWGRNGSGQVGNGATDPETRGDDVITPTAVVDIASISDIWLGNNFSCVLLPDASVKCWGADGDGQLGNGGDGSDPDSWSPVQVTDLTAGVAVAITASAGHACVLIAAVSPLTGNEARCWGRNGDGQLGVSDRDNRYTPTQVTDMASGVAAISAGWMHSCLITDATEVECSGAGGDGQIGSVYFYDSSTFGSVLSF